MLNDIESILVTEEQIDEITSRIAGQITNDYKNSNKKLVFICILKGSLMFTCELMKKVQLPIELDFMKVSSYGASTSTSGIINIHLDIKRSDLSDADFIVVEDIIDSGKTLSHLVKYLSEKGANSVKQLLCLTNLLAVWLILHPITAAWKYLTNSLSVSDLIMMKNTVTFHM